MAEVSNHSPLRGTFRPLVGSRRGEAYAWGLAGALALTAAITAWQLGTVPWFLWLLLGFFLGSALLSTFSNWVDSRTVLVLSNQGLVFRNGLRHVRLSWSEVESLRVLTDRWGKRVQVSGKDGQHFAFRTLAEVEIHAGQPQKLFGFAEGERLAEAIVQAAGLTAQPAADDEVYYARP